MSSAMVHPVDEKLPTPRLAALGLQHVLVMYAEAVAVPARVERDLRARKVTPKATAYRLADGGRLYLCVPRIPGTPIPE